MEDVLSLIFLETDFETCISMGTFYEAKKLYNNPEEINFKTIYNESNFISFMVENYIETFINMTAILVENGFLESLKYLHKNNLGKFSKDAMEWAAKYGNLDIVRFLHENRPEGYTKDTVGLAARNGHLESR